MKKQFKKLFNNRIFRTFIEAAFAVILAYFAEAQLNIESKELVGIIITAIATGLSKILPLLDENEENAEEFCNDENN